MPAVMYVRPALPQNAFFDSNKFDSAQKANVDSFEEKMFHVIRAFHVAGRCTDCGECKRVCPQGIPFICLTVSLSRILMRFTVSIRQARMRSQRVRLPALPLRM